MFSFLLKGMGLIAGCWRTNSVRAFHGQVEGEWIVPGYLEETFEAGEGSRVWGRVMG